MTFQTTYSNITVDTQLTTSNLTATALQTTVSNVTITGGLTGQFLTANGSGGDTLFANVAAGSQPQAPGGDKQIMFSDPSGLYGYGATPNLTFNKADNSLNLTGTLLTTSIITTGNVTFSDISNVNISGGAPGQAIVTDGAGNLRFEFVGASGLTADALNAVFSPYIQPSGTSLPVGTNQAVWLADSAQDANSIQVGTQFAFSNDPQNICTVQNVVNSANPNIPGGRILSVQWYPPIRYTTDISYANKTRILLPVVQQFGNLVVDSGTISANLIGNTLTLTGQLPAGVDGSVQINDNGNLGNTANLTFNQTQNILNVVGNATVTNNTSVQQAANTNSGIFFNNTGNIVSSGGFTNIPANLVVSNSITSGALRRGIRIAECYGYLQSIPPNFVAPIVWNQTSNNMNLTPFPSAASTTRWTNTSQLTMYLLVTYQVSWQRSSDQSTRRCFIAKNNDTTYQRLGEVSTYNNYDDFTIQNGTGMLVLAPGDYFEVYCVHDSGSQLNIGGDYGGQTSGYSNKLTFTVL